MYCYRVLLPKTATTSLAPASRGCDAGPLPPGALVVPGHRPRPAVWRSVYRAGILGDSHRPAVISSGRAKPAADRSWAIPTRPECPVMFRQPGSPAARAACWRRRRMVSGWRLKTGVTASITASSGRMDSRASTADVPRYNTPPRPPGRPSTPESGCGRCRLRPAPRLPSAGRRPRRPAAARRA